MNNSLLANDTEPNEGATTTPGGGEGADAPPATGEQTSEDQATTTSTDDATTTDDTTESTPNAPETYEFTVPTDMPEGYELDGAVVDEVSKVARELDLTQVQAQSLVDGVLPVLHRRSQEQQAALHETWLSQTKADKELGGHKLAETVAVAKRAVRAYGTDGLQELLDGAIGSHPEVVRFLAKIGRTVSEDEFVDGGKAKDEIDLNDDAAIAKILYPTSQ